jgi:hypothetical protein
VSMGDKQYGLPLLGFDLGIDSGMGSLCEWLTAKGLVRESKGYDRVVDGKQWNSVTEDLILGMPCHRVEKKTQDEMKQLIKEDGDRFSLELRLDQEQMQRLWDEVRDPRSAMRALDPLRIPADAMAYYRPFHFPPFHNWGIYLLIDRLLNYCDALQETLGKLRLFTQSTLAAAVLFEIFHHEFFHHLAESTATALEIICAGMGSPRRIYLDYWDSKFEDVIGKHSHHPLEEALANAYAYNAFSFISRVKVGYRVSLSVFYQHALIKMWPKEPAGYREAEHYIKGGYVGGAAQLLAMLISHADAFNEAPLMTLAKKVFPQGNTALMSKPEIPTYLVGTPDQIMHFDSLVPAPNEAYTNLFWPGDTSNIDKMIQENRQKEREARKRRQAGIG